MPYMLNAAQLAYPDLHIESTCCTIVMVESKMTLRLRTHAVDAIRELPTCRDTLLMYCELCFDVHNMTSVLSLFSFNMF